MNGNIEGKGKMTYVDGKVTDGEWANGVQHGFARIYFNDGRVRTGTWDNGKLIESTYKTEK